MNILTPPKLSTGKVGGEFGSSAGAAAVDDEVITGGSDAAKLVGSADVGRAGEPREPGDALAPGDSLDPGEDRGPGEDRAPGEDLGPAPGEERKGFALVSNLGGALDIGANI